jgi:hypothetical protein
MIVDVLGVANDPAGRDRKNFAVKKSGAYGGSRVHNGAKKALGRLTEGLQIVAIDPGAA